MQSPWSQFTRAFCLPDACGCEFVDLQAWIAQKSAFWTSSFHLFFALLLYFQVKERSQRFKFWIFSLLLLGLASHFGHGTFLEVGMAMDFAGIVQVISFFAIYPWLSRITKSFLPLILLFIGYQFSLVLIFFNLYKWFKFSLCVGVFVLSMGELVKAEGSSFFKAKSLHQALGVFFISLLFFLADEMKLWCDPHSWFTGHSVWHFGTGLGLYLYGRWRFRDVL
jgi:hypothetical protein